MMQQRESLLDWARASRCRSRSRKTSGCEKIGTGTSQLREIPAKHRHPLGASPIFSQLRPEILRIRLLESLTTLPFVALFLGVLASSLLRPNDLAAQQQAWEYSPYKVQIWLATETAGDLDGRVRESLSFALARRIAASIG